MEETFARFRRLDPEKIVDTVRSLHGRIEDRFPGSGLGKVIAELLIVAGETLKRTHWIQKPHLLLRAVATLLSVAIIALMIGLAINIHQFNFNNDFTNAVQALDSSISSVVFVGAAILFFISWENRIPKKSLSLTIIWANNYRSLEKNEDNMKIIEKYINLGIIKKFGTKSFREDNIEKSILYYNY